MPFEPTSPESVEITVPSQVSKPLDCLKVSGLQIMLAGEQPELIVHWFEGYDEGGELQIVNAKQYQANFDEIVAAMTSVTQNGATVKDAIKEAAYNLLVAAEQIPPGSVV